MPLKITVLSLGDGLCTLTAREGAGATVHIEGERPAFLTWGGLQQMLRFKLSGPETQNGRLLFENPEEPS